MKIFKAILIALAAVGAKFLLTEVVMKSGPNVSFIAETYLPFIIIFCTGIILRQIDKRNGKDVDDAFFDYLQIFGKSVAGVIGVYIGVMLVTALVRTNDLGILISILNGFTVVVAAICTALICKKINGNGENTKKRNYYEKKTIKR